jgi:hypothetical protein
VAARVVGSHVVSRDEVMGTRNVGIDRVAPFNDSRGRYGDPDGGTVVSSGVGDLSDADPISPDQSWGRSSPPATVSRLRAGSP